MYQKMLIDMKATLVNIKTDSYDVYIGRGSKWGNPFSHLKNSKALYKVKNRKEAVLRYFEWITKGEGKYLLKYLHELDGKILGCYCSPKLCHGNVLLKLLEKYNELKCKKENM